ncbi:MAG: ABC transporter permease, partial [Acidobacteriaceae bacterium]
ALGNVKTMQAAQDNPIAFAVMMFLTVGTLALPIAAIITGQEAIIGERQSGTAAWLLSKPVSRPAFILSKLAASTVGMSVTAVVIQGIVAYAILSIRIGKPWPVAGFLGSMGMVFLNLFFYLTLTYMLGSIFSNRGPVLGISLAMALVGPSFLRTMPIIKDITPWGFFLNITQDVPLGLGLALGQTPASVIPVIGTAVICLAFIVVALVRFQREEF